MQQMKTPEQLAEEYVEDHDECEFAREAYLAGYKAAQEHAHAALEEAEVRVQELADQLADTSKVMNSPETPDSCDYILDMDKMTDRVGLEPTTKRLTAAHSTIELPIKIVG